MAVARHAVILCATLAAFLGQSILTQTHIHQAPSRVAAAHPGLFAARQAPPRQPPADCPICREIAHAGAYIMPAVIGLAGAAGLSYWLIVPPFLHRTREARSHSWHSRGPPRPILI